MEKIKLDWKAPSEAKMIEFVSQLDADKRDAFAKACIVELEDGTRKFVRSKAKKWLVDNYDDSIEWSNRPEKKEKKLSNVDLVASWLKK